MAKEYQVFLHILFRNNLVMLKIRSVGILNFEKEEPSDRGIL